MSTNILGIMCLNCMRNIGEEFQTCPFCGSPADISNQFHQLVPGSILNGKYLVGKALGQGGFGITYTGLDLIENTKVAIKEYYPDGSVSRQKDRYTIMPYNDDLAKTYENRKIRFLNEAKKLALFRQCRGIVDLRDSFEENGTSYIVMEHLEGPTLKEYFRSKNKPLSPEEMLYLLEPVFNAVSIINNENIIHRDISPDNIIVTNDGGKLLDFGAASEFSWSGNDKHPENIKSGYTPKEQYMNRGKQGPWTDVYSLAATFYRGVTGKTPPPAIDRMSNDELELPTMLNRKVSVALEYVLLKALAVNAKDRYQWVNEFYNELVKAIPHN